jgi:hypothetical protein
MVVQFPRFSYTKPRPLLKRRTRPSKAAFRAVVTHLNSIDCKAGRFLVLAIVKLLNDEEISPEDEYRMVTDAAQ